MLLILGLRLRETWALIVRRRSGRRGLRARIVRGSANWGTLCTLIMGVGRLSAERGLRVGAIAVALRVLVSGLCAAGRRRQSRSTSRRHTGSKGWTLRGVVIGVSTSGRRSRRLLLVTLRGIVTAGLLVASVVALGRTTRVVALRIVRLL